MADNNEILTSVATSQIISSTTGEILHADADALDKDRRLAMTLVGGPDAAAGRLDEATWWLILPASADSGGGGGDDEEAGARTVRILHQQRGEHLFAGSKCLDDQRRHALTWKGRHNGDPAMLWQLIPVGGGEGEGEGEGRGTFRIKHLQTGEFLYTGSSMVDARRR